MKYCLRHGKNVWVQGHPGFHYEMTKVPEWAPDVEVCQGPFAECEPPTLEEDWQDHLSVPPPADMFQYNNQFDYDPLTDAVVQVNLI